MNTYGDEAGKCWRRVNGNVFGLCARSVEPYILSVIVVIARSHDDGNTNIMSRFEDLVGCLHRSTERRTSYKLSVTHQKIISLHFLSPLASYSPKLMLMTDFLCRLLDTISLTAQSIPAKTVDHSADSSSVPKTLTDFNELCLLTPYVRPPIIPATCVA